MSTKMGYRPFLLDFWYGYEEILYKGKVIHLKAIIDVRKIEEEYLKKSEELLLLPPVNSITLLIVEYLIKNGIPWC